MDVNSRNRTELKSYFLKNSIPTESNFAELIDGMINQKDDGIVKLPGNPLSVEAVGDDNSPKKLINFYRSFTAAQPDWTINLNPWADANDSTTAQAGFAISDGEGNNRLFIDRSTGHLGIKTTSPGAALDIKADTKTVAGWFEAIRLSQEAHSAITHPGGGLLFGLHGNRKFYFSDIKGGTLQKHVTVIDAESGNVGIGTDKPSGKLTVDGVSEGENGLEVKGSIGNSHIPFTNGSVYLTGYNGNDKNGDFIFRTYNGSKYTERFVIDGTTGHLGIKTTTPGAALDVKADTKTDRGWFEAIRLSQDAHSAITHPGGGLLLGLHGNRKFYFGDFKNGSFQKYVTVIDAESGRVGIGTDNPSGKLTVDGVSEGENGLEVKGSIGNSHIPYSNGSVYLTGYNGNDKNGDFIFRTYNGSQYTNRFVIDGPTGNINVTGVINATNAMPIRQQLVHRRVVFGFAGDNPVDYGQGWKLIRYVYGPFGYAIPALQAGATRKFRLYAIYSDSMTTSGENRIQFRMENKDIVVFNLGRTWGHVGNNRDAYSSWFDGEAPGGHGTIEISTTEKAEGRIYYLELQTWDFF